MNTPQSKESENRSLYTSAPIFTASLPAAPPRRHRLLAAILSYPLAYLYARYVFFAWDRFAEWGMPVFALLFVLGVHLLAKAEHRTAARETPLWAGCFLALSATVTLFGHQPVGLDLWQALAWHLFAIWYVLARCGVLAQGYTGSLVFLDAWVGLFTLPWPYFLYRLKTLWRAVRAIPIRPKPVQWRRAAAMCGTAALTVGITFYAAGLLASVNEHFAALAQGVIEFLTVPLPQWDLGAWMVYFILSLPVGAWLFGLVSGALHQNKPPVTVEQFAQTLAPLRRLPAFTATAVLTALCLLYVLFFGVQVSDFAAAAGLGMDAATASDFAVQGFWELCRILLLNFTVLAVIRFFCRKKPAQWLTAAFCISSVAFAALGGAKLGTYIVLFGFTPRRVVSGWFLCVLAVWSVLLLVRVFRPLPVARIGLAVLVLSFTVLCCTDMKHWIACANIDRYAAGIDAELDETVLEQCGVGDYAWWESPLHPQWEYAQRLIDAGWFTGRSSEEIAVLYQVYNTKGKGSKPMEGGALLTVIFDEAGRCTEAEITLAG